MSNIEWLQAANIQHYITDNVLHIYTSPKNDVTIDVNILTPIAQIYTLLMRNAYWYGGIATAQSIINHWKDVEVESLISDVPNPYEIH